MLQPIQRHAIPAGPALFSVPRDSLSSQNVSRDAFCLVAHELQPEFAAH